MAPWCRRGGRRGRDVAAGDDEGTIEADGMNACTDVLTPLPTALHSLLFEGNLQAVAAQVRIVLNSFGLGALTVPHVPQTTTAQNAMQSAVDRKGAFAPHGGLGGVQDRGSEFEVVGSRR